MSAYIISKSSMILTALIICKKLLNSAKWSFNGLRYAFNNDISFKLEIFLTIILSPLAVYVSENLNQLFFLLFSLYAILVVELINTAIESLVDRIGLEHNELSKNAKDVGSAAVFLTILFMFLVWSLVLYENLHN